MAEKARNNTYSILVLSPRDIKDAQRRRHNNTTLSAPTLCAYAACAYAVSISVVRPSVDVSARSQLSNDCACISPAPCTSCVLLPALDCTHPCTTYRTSEARWTCLLPISPTEFHVHEPLFQHQHKSILPHQSDGILCTGSQEPLFQHQRDSTLPHQSKGAGWIGFPSCK
jgi:hypothetical protein